MELKDSGIVSSFLLKETERGIEFCGGDATRYYFDDKEPEELPSSQACVLLPKEFLPELKRLLEEIPRKKEVK